MSPGENENLFASGLGRGPRMNIDALSGKPSLYKAERAVGVSEALCMPTTWLWFAAFEIVAPLRCSHERSTRRPGLQVLPAFKRCSEAGTTNKAGYEIP